MRACATCGAYVLDDRPSRIVGFPHGDEHRRVLISAITCRNGHARSWRNSPIWRELASGAGSIGRACSRTPLEMAWHGGPPKRHAGGGTAGLTQALQASLSQREERLSLTLRAWNSRAAREPPPTRRIKRALQAIGNRVHHQEAALRRPFKMPRYRPVKNSRLSRKSKVTLIGHSELR